MQNISIAFDWRDRRYICI